MDQAKQAVSGFLKHGGREDTEVDEHVRPVVTEETIKPTRHEETTQAVDREVHKHHYHTTVQPLQHQERLPEQHTSQVAPTQERVIRHDNEDEAKARFAAEAGQFRDSRQVEGTRETSSQAAAQTGEHTHHHVHEVVQPVVHKTTHQPEVVHTVVPIHEKIHAPSEHHGLSVLPERSLQDFNAAGGTAHGSGDRQHHEEYEGHPRPYNPQLQQDRKPADLEPEKHWGSHDTAATGHPPIGSDIDSGSAQGSSGVGLGSSGVGHSSSGVGHSSSGVGHSSSGIGSGTSGTEQRSSGLTGGSSGLTGGSSGVGHSSSGVGHSSSGIGSGTSGTEQRSSGLTGGSSGLTGGSSGVGDSSSGVTGSSRGVDDGSSGTKPWSSNLLNKLDPRVDSTGGAGGSTGSNTGGIAASGGTGTSSSGYHGSNVAGGTGGSSADIRHGDATGTDSYRDSGVGLGGSSTSGQHSSNLANKADPRIDSDRDGSRTAGGVTGAGLGSSSTSGPHDSNLANKADPRVDSDRDGSRTAGGATSGSGKVDPAVQGGEHTKLTGTGEPGSHSAVFGLTPDGHKEDKTDSSSSGAIRGAHSGHMVGEGQERPSGDVGSRAATGSAVAEQLNDPRVGEKEHAGQQSYGKMDAGDKPGSGSTFTNTPQGSGNV